ncbi:hypothetical protein [Arenibaculum pallidiluteum]|uniref:hypothetical protein n=1 Tax=Arenibaculum pallidiluteum TaxID=2812559 RepID=UPI001A97CF19|nr:hypothetical protein [Arenibaculum pallidiluteum]
MWIAFNLIGPLLVGIASMIVREARYGLGAEILLGLGAAWLALSLVCLLLGIRPLRRR